MKGTAESWTAITSRNTISVEEEKMHHGHADENSIVSLMDGDQLLLHDAGYRDGLPSGKFGAWRQDYFHNRLVVRMNKRDPASRRSSSHGIREPTGRCPRPRSTS